jgi:hypothetical protein
MKTIGYILLYKIGVNTLSWEEITGPVYDTQEFLQYLEKYELPVYQTNDKGKHSALQNVMALRYRKLIVPEGAITYSSHNVYEHTLFLKYQDEGKYKSKELITVHCASYTGDIWFNSPVEKEDHILEIQNLIDNCVSVVNTLKDSLLGQNFRNYFAKLLQKSQAIQLNNGVYFIPMKYITYWSKMKSICNKILPEININFLQIDDYQTNIATLQKLKEKHYE